MRCAAPVVGAGIDGQGLAVLVDKALEAKANRRLRSMVFQRSVPPRCAALRSRWARTWRSIAACTPLPACPRSASHASKHARAPRSASPGCSGDARLSGEPAGGAHQCEARGHAPALGCSHHLAPTRIPCGAAARRRARALPPCDRPAIAARPHPLRHSGPRWPGDRPRQSVCSRPRPRPHHAGAGTCPAPCAHRPAPTACAPSCPSCGFLPAWAMCWPGCAHPTTETAGTRCGAGQAQGCGCLGFFGLIGQHVHSFAHQSPVGLTDLVEHQQAVGCCTATDSTPESVARPLLLKDSAAPTRCRPPATPSSCPGWFPQ